MSSQSMEALQQPRYPSCTPVLLEKSPFLLIRGDMQRLFNYDVVLTTVARLFEVETNSRIAALRRRYGIPDHMLPADEYLWLDEPSLRMMANMTQRVRGKSSLARAMSLSHPKKPTLIQLGILAVRYVARPRAGRRRPRHYPDPMRATFLDHNGVECLLVDDRDGFYKVDGELHLAAESGFSRVARQILYCFDALNTALALLDGLPVPEPAPRWCIDAPQETQERQEESMRPNPYDLSRYGRSRTNRAADVSNSGQSHQNTSAHSSDIGQSNQNAMAQLSNSGQRQWRDCPTSDKKMAQLSNSGQISARNNKDITEKESITTKKVSNNYGPLSKYPLLRDSIKLEEWRTRPYTPELIVALSSFKFAIPDINAIEEASDVEASELWTKEWLISAQELYAKTAHRDPVRAWQEVDNVSRFMTTPGSGSFWQTKYTGEPITLRHVAEKFEIELRKYLQSPWQPAETTPYDGPGIYEQGYRAVSPSTERTTEPLDQQPKAMPAPPSPPSPTPPEPPVVAFPKGQEQEYAGMTKKRVDSLFKIIRQDAPELTYSLESDEVSPGLYRAYLECAEGQWIELCGIIDWDHPTPELAEAIKAARWFGAARIAEGAIPVDES